MSVSWPGFLRLLGFDTIFFCGENDTQLVNRALRENRTILTRDTLILKRKLVTGGKVKAILMKSDDPEKQIQQVMGDLKLEPLIRPFTICLEDNQVLIYRTKEEVRDRVPLYVWQTQQEYVECPRCHRIYWKGTHWQAMRHRLKKLDIDQEREKL